MWWLRSVFDGGPGHRRLAESCDPMMSMGNNDERGQSSAVVAQTPICNLGEWGDSLKLHSLNHRV